MKVGDYVVVKHGSICHQSVWGKVGQIVPRIDGYKGAFLVRFSFPVPPLDGLDMSHNRGERTYEYDQDYYYLFYIEEIAPEPFMTACQEILDRKENTK